LKFSDQLRFSGGALRGHRLRTALSLLGVAIGVTAVILLTSLGEGARLYVTGEFAALGTNLIIVLPGKTETTGMSPVIGGAPNDLTLDDADAVERRVRAVRRVAPLVLGTATARYRNRSRESTVFGTTREWLGVRQLSVRTGRFLPAGEGDRNRHVCVIGSKIQSELFPATNPLGEILRLGDERFRVIGVAAPRGVSLGMDLNEAIYVPVSRALKMFNRSSLFRILAEVRSHEEIDSAREAILALLKERHDHTEDVTVVTQDSVMSTFGNILAILTAALAGIAAISLTVAGVGIMNVMLVSVSERIREIGLLKALGATPRQLLQVFLLEAAILSTAGGLLGLLIGFAAAAMLRGFYPAFPVEPPTWAVVSAIAVSFSVGLLFGALPARRAARLDPVVALAGR